MLERFRCTSSGKNRDQVALWGPGHTAPSPRESQALGRWQNVGLEHEWGTEWAGSCPPQQGGAHLPCELDGGAGLWVAGGPVGPWATSPQQGRPAAGRGPRGPGVITPPETTPPPELCETWGPGEKKEGNFQEGEI